MTYLLTFLVALFSVCASVLPYGENKIFVRSVDNAGAMNFSKFKIAKRFSGITMTVENEIGHIQQSYRPVDLSTGAPDYLPPSFIVHDLDNIMTGPDIEVEQYSSPDGHPYLRKVIAEIYSKEINLELDPNKNVIVTVGSSEALCSIVQAFTNPGDEWIIIEPAFISYRDLVETAEGVPKYVQLRPKRNSGRIYSEDWVFDKNEMANAFNEKTKGVIVNNPQNPTGKIFSMEELQFIADLAKKWNTLVLSDEVYEWMIYKPGKKFVRIASLPGMYERTISISSASKTFSVTGWRIGWIYGPVELLDNVRPVHARTVYSNPTPPQVAVANSLENLYKDLDQSNSYMSTYMKDLQLKRNYLINVIEEIGMSPTIPDSAFYITANYAPVARRAKLQNEKGHRLDVKFVKWLAKNVGVLVAPLSRFYGNGTEHFGENYVRFCFARDSKVLERGAQLLRQWAR